MQPRRRLVEEIEGAPGGAPRQLLGELDPLRLAARQRGCLLPDMDVAEPHPLQRHELVAHRRHGPEELGRLAHRHVEDIGDRLFLEGDLERLAIVALAVAGIAGDINIRQEVHLDLDDAVALAGFAPPTLDVEREAARTIAARLGLGQPGEPVANRREGAGVGGRVGPRRAPDRRLVDVDDLVELLEPLDPVVLRRHFARSHELSRRRLVERVDEQGGFAAARHAGHRREHPERDLRCDVLEIVGRAPRPP